jgi:hypothetical protein
LWALKVPMRALVAAHGQCLLSPFLFLSYRACPLVTHLPTHGSSAATALAPVCMASPVRRTLSEWTWLLSIASAFQHVARDHRQASVWPPSGRYHRRSVSHLHQACTCSSSLAPGKVVTHGFHGNRNLACAFCVARVCPPCAHQHACSLSSLCCSPESTLLIPPRHCQRLQSVRQAASAHALDRIPDILASLW